MLVFELVRILEARGDLVTQFALIDHFPTAFLAPTLGVNVSKISLAEEEARQIFIDASRSTLVDATRCDGGGSVLKRHQLADDLSAAFRELPVSSFAQGFKETLDQFLNQIFDFLLSFQAFPSPMNALESWMKSVKAPISIYLGSYGLPGSVLLVDRLQWYDLGVSRCFPDARVTFLNAGHFDILANGIMIEALQVGYARVLPRL